VRHADRGHRRRPWHPAARTPLRFKVEHDDDLAVREQRVESYGYRVGRVHRGEEVGQGEPIRFETPSGHEIELVRDVERLGSDLPTVDPTRSAPAAAGQAIAPPRMDHVLVTAEEVPEATRFYTDVLGFRLTEQGLNTHPCRVLWNLRNEGDLGLGSVYRDHACRGSRGPCWAYDEYSVRIAAGRTCQ